MDTKKGSNYIYETVEYTVHSEKDETTNVNTTKWTFDWTIRNFYKLLGDKNISGIRTKKPTDIPPSEIKLQLKMQFLGRNRDLIEIYCLSPTPVVLKLAFTCLSNMTRELEFKEHNIVTNNDSYTVDANKWYFLTALFKRRDDKLVDYDTNTLSLLQDGGLHLRFKFTITNKPEGNKCNVPATQFMSDFESLLNESTFSDVVIKSIDDEVFKAHKAVLISRCAVIKAHFEHNTTETVTNILESPFESEVLREIVFFIYTDKVPKIDDMPEKLLAAADYYQLNLLKSLCEKSLIQKLTIENALETLQLADLYSADTLKQMTLDFIRDEDPQLKLITKTEGWTQVQSVHFIKIICEHIAAEDTDEKNPSPHAITIFKNLEIGRRINSFIIFE